MLEQVLVLLLDVGGHRVEVVEVDVLVAGRLAVVFHAELVADDAAAGDGEEDGEDDLKKKWVW